MERELLQYRCFRLRNKKSNEFFHAFPLRDYMAMCRRISDDNIEKRIGAHRDTWRIYDLSITIKWREVWLGRRILIRCVLEDFPESTDKIFRRMIKYKISLRKEYDVSCFVSTICNASDETIRVAMKIWPERFEKWQSAVHHSPDLEKVRKMIDVIGISPENFMDELKKINKYVVDTTKYLVEKKKND